MKWPKMFRNRSPNLANISAENLSAHWKWIKEGRSGQKRAKRASCQIHFHFTVSFFTTKEYFTIRKPFVKSFSTRHLYIYINCTRNSEQVGGQVYMCNFNRRSHVKKCAKFAMTISRCKKGREMSTWALRFYNEYFFPLWKS